MAADVKAKAFAGAHAQVRPPRMRTRNADLQAAAAQAKGVADQANAELAAATKSVTDATNAVNAANAAYGPAAQNAHLSAASAKLAADILAPRAAAAKLAADAVGPLKANFDKATAELNAAKAEMDKVKAAATPPKKG